MKNGFHQLLTLIRLSLISIALMWIPTSLNGQCQCQGEDLDPTDGYHNYVVQYDQNGMMKNYSYSFQFGCIDEPLPLGGQYFYKIIYREKGTTEWQIMGDLAGMISDGPPFGPDLLVSVGPFDFCKTYEVRITCPTCGSSVGVGCTSQEQLEAYLNNNDDAIENVSSIFELCYSPLTAQVLKNLKISSVNTATNSVTISWDLFPVSVNYQVLYRKKPSLGFVELGSTTQNSFEISDLEPCAEYDVIVRGYIENCCNQTKYSFPATVNFKVTDCISSIKKVDFITGNSAHVTWGVVGSGQTPQDYVVEWWQNINNIMSATTSDMEYILTNLDPNSSYNVRVISNCGPNVCASPSQLISFETNCELHEPNNSFETATPIPFDTDVSNVNIYTAGDEDYFKFIPTTCHIEIKVDHPTLPNYSFNLEADLPYVLYDKNFQEVPRYGSYTDGVGHLHTHLHYVKPGQEYYIKASGKSNNWENTSCYTVKAMPCTGCDPNPNYTIWGPQKVFSVPLTVDYQLNSDAANIEWSVTGPANLILQSEQYFCQLEFYDLGSVTLTATITTCDGSVNTIVKEITVTNECYIEGYYTNAFNSSGLNEGFNLVKKLNFTIFLNTPPDIAFNVYLDSGTATWEINDNQIFINQISSTATFKIELEEGNCNNFNKLYTFIKWPTGTAGGPVEWSLSPNPTSGTLIITPTIAGDVDPNTVPDNAEIRLYNQNALLKITQQGSTKNVNQLDLNNLVPGNYSLQVLYGGYWEQFNVIKQ